MLRVLLGFVRATSAVAVGAACLAVAACGGQGAAGSAAPSASPTADPLRALSASQIEAKAVADAAAASTFTLDGVVDESGQTESVDLAIKKGVGCNVTVGTGDGTVQLMELGTTVYLNPSTEFWEKEGGSQGSALATLIDGRWIKSTTNDATFKSMIGMCNVSQLLSSSGYTPGKVVKGPVTTLDGTRVLALKDTTDGGTIYVTDSAAPELVESTAPKGAKGGAGIVKASVDVPVTLTAPAASDVIAGSQLGL